MPVTHAKALISCGFNLLYSSAIQAISLFPVPISGAGTFRLGDIRPLLTSSSVKRLVIFSRSSSEYLAGLIFKPPLEPPKGTSITAFLKVIRAAIASTSDALTAGLYLIPPFTGSRCSECTERHPVNTFIPLLNLTPNRIVWVLLQDLICFAKPGSTPSISTASSNIFVTLFKNKLSAPIFPPINCIMI